MAPASGDLRFGTPAGRWVIAATVLGSGIAFLDGTIVNVALPAIGRALKTDVAGLQWTVDAYLVFLTALLLFGGALGDRFGRRRVFVVGLVSFTAASVACAVAPDATALAISRAVQGAAGALLVPGSLAIIGSAFHDSDRGRAIGAWSGLGGVATAAGPLLGGYLIAAASWRWIFLINIPVGALVLLLSVRHVPESRDPTAGRGVDVPGAVLATAALGGITFGLIEGPARGWGSAPAPALALVAGAVCAAAFVAIERRSRSPMLPLAVFRSRQFTVTNAVTFIVYAALGGALFLLPVELQVVDGYTPLESGVALLPLTVVMLLLSARSGRLASRIGPRLQMSVGPVVVGGGLALLARSTTDPSYPSGVLPAVLVFGLGLAITVAPLTTTALGAVPDEHAGLASAVNNDVARVGSLIAVAVLPALAGISGSSYLHPAQLASGFRTAVLIAAVMCAAGGVIAAIGIRNPAPGPVPEPERVECLHCALDATPVATDAASLATGA